MLGAFEVVLATAVVSGLAGWFGTLLAFAVSQAIGNDVFGSTVSAIIWGPVFALIGAFVALKLLAR